MDKENLQGYLKILLCFNGPVQEAVVYLYSQTYTQDVDIPTHIKKCGLEKNFSRHDLGLLHVEKRPIKLPLTVLFKVLKCCCAQILFSTNGKNWDKECDSSIECTVVRLNNLYKKFLILGVDLADGNLSGFCASLKAITFDIIEKAAQLSGAKRWQEVQEKLSKLFTEIETLSASEYFSASDLLRIEVSSQNERLMEIFQNELPTMTSTAWDLKVNPKDLNKFCEEEDPLDIELDDIYDVAIEHDKRILCISGCQGNGKTALSSYISLCWWGQAGIKKINFFDLVVVISAAELADNRKCVSFLSRFAAFCSKDAIVAYLKEKTILMLIDDIDDVAAIEKNVATMLKQFPRLYLTCFGNNLFDVIRLKGYNFLSFQFNGYKEEILLSLVDSWVNFDQSLREYLLSHINRYRPFIKYPSLLQDISFIWSINRDFFNDASTPSDLMWKIFEWKTSRQLNVDVNYPDDKRKRFNKWMEYFGLVLTQSNLLGRKIPQTHLDDIRAELVKLFPSTGADFFKVVFKPTVSHCFSGKCYQPSATLPDVEFLCGWYFVQKTLDKTNSDTPHAIDESEEYKNVILFSAGHLYRLQDEGSLTITNEKRLIKALIRYRLEESYEDLPFIFRFVTELKCIKRLVHIVVDNTEYNEEWCLCPRDLQFRSLSTMLAHVSPVRLIFLVDDDIYNNAEISDIMEYVCRVKVSVWFDSGSQFCYGNSRSMDKLLQPFLTGKVIPKLDFLCGYLTPQTIVQISETKSFQNLVLLKLRLTCKDGLDAALKAPKSLPRLLWLEIRIDFNFMDLNVSNVFVSEVPLFDVYFSRIEEDEVTDLADLLVRMHCRFTGIHLDDTKFTPEGVYTLLKELAKRNVSLCAEKEVMNKFRRWYYPTVSCIPRWKPLTEEEIIHHIGYDDSNFYSDHKVVSSQFVTNLDAWNLRTYLESEPSIKHFCYETSNIIFTKELSGKVEVKFKEKYLQQLKASTRKMSKETNTVLKISGKCAQFD